MLQFELCAIVRHHRRCFYKILLLVFLLVAGHNKAQASTIVVPSGGDFQLALNQAQPGDLILLEPGVAYVGNFVLPLKSGTAFITIQTSSQLPSGRISPASVGLLPKLQAPNSDAVIKASPGAHHFQFVGVEVSTTSASIPGHTLIELGDSSQTSLSAVPHDIVFDRCWIHGFTTQEVQRGVSLNGAEITITNCYINDIHGAGYDTQAIAGWAGPGPFHITNNYLEAAGENVMFGGADPKIANLVPSDIEIRNNSVKKPLSWKVGDPAYGGIHWSIKNLLELKNARRVTIDSNTFDNNWVDAQAGCAILFTVRNQEGTAPWSTIENVSFTNNIVRNSPQGINLLGSDNLQPSQRATGLNISNNLVLSITGTFFTMQGYYNVTLSHNTHFQSGNIMTLYGEPSIGFVAKDNLTLRADSGYGIKGDGTGEGTIALNTFTPAFGFEKNAVIYANAAFYPTGSFYPTQVSEVGFADYSNADYRLLNASPYHNAATDGKDVGVDFNMLPTGGATPTPTPNPSPTPTATPTPLPSPSPTPTGTPTPTPTPTPAPSANVSFVRLDSGTSGNWKSIYGAEGYNTINDAVRYPAYIQVSASGYSSPTWAAPSTDPRALQNIIGSGRIAARWESNSFFTIDVNLNDGQTHRMAIYGLDWDGNNRSQQIDVVDAETNALLDSRGISSFHGGQYLVWDVRGHIKLRIYKTGAKTAVVSGLYFGGPLSTPNPTPSPTPTPSASPTPTPTATPTPNPSPTPNLGNSVVHAKRTGQNLSNQLVSENSPSGTNESPIDQSVTLTLRQFVSDVQQADAIFNDNKALYPAAARIDLALQAAVTAGLRSSDAATQGDMDAVKRNLREAINNLELSDVLITYGDVANPIDTPSYMVRQHYVDFLDREPDQAGSDFWIAQMQSCGTDRDCVDVKRINASAAFFLSIEFHETAFFAYRLYKSSYGRAPRLPEFLSDRSKIARGVIVGPDGWEARLAANKQAFLQDWTQRAEFQTRYAILSDQQYVDALIANMGGTITTVERDALLQNLANGESRTNVLRSLVENPTFSRSVFNSAFVLTQYFGYLGREPDTEGFNFWLQKLNEFDGNFVNAEMVKAFLLSSEYRHRFGQ